MSDRRALPTSLLLFALTIAVTLAAWWAMPATMRMSESTDYVIGYRVTAHALLEGRGLVGQDGTPATHFPPGYPLILVPLFRLAAATGLAESNVVRACALFSAGLASFLLHRAALRLWRPVPAALVALAWVTYLPGIWMTHLLGSEPHFMAAFFGALVLTLRGLRATARGGPSLFMAGLAFGGASLLRTQGMVVGPLVAVAIAWWIRGVSMRTRAGLAGALLAGNLLMVLPWEVYAWTQVHRVIPLSTNGPGSIVNGLTFALPAPGNEPRTLSAPMADLMQAIASRKSEVAAPGGGLGVVIEEMVERPSTAAVLVAWKAARSWYATDSMRHEGPMFLLQGLYLSLFAASGVLAWRAGGARRRAALAIGLLILQFWVMTTIVLSIARYMIPAMALGFLIMPHLVPARWRTGGSG